MYLIQLTDLHIGLPGEDTRGVDVRENFLRTLERVQNLKPDRLVLTGDLCFADADAGIYQWIRDQLDALAIPYDPIAGNHDQSRLLAEAFDREADLTGEELFFRRSLGEWEALFLDTAPGAMSRDQFTWLEEQLTSAGGPWLFFMHHPPARAAVPYMDRQHNFRDMERFQEVMAAAKGAVEIFCGHYHVEKTVRLPHLAVHITPSLFFQIDMHREDFGVDHYRPGFRELWLEGERLLHTVAYLDMAK